MIMDYEQRIAELEAENEQLKIGIDEGVRPLPYWERLKKAEADAERYRWLADERMAAGGIYTMATVPRLKKPLSKQKLDAAIDAARG